MPLRRVKSSMEQGRHGKGAPTLGRRAINPSSPTSGSNPEFNGLHPERIKELQNEGEEQAEDQIEQPSAPFGRGSMLDEEPGDTGEITNTMPVHKPPAGLKHKQLPHPQLPNMQAASAGHIPEVDANSGAMKRSTRRGKSLFYGD